MTSRELFDRAVELVIEHEGDNFTDRPDDRGGPTKFGISQRWNPDVDVRNLTRSQAIEIYWERYWLGNGYDRLPEAIAIKVFDLAIPMGRGPAIKCLQRALRACQIMVKVDGILGSETWHAAGAVPVEELLAAIRSEAAGECRLIVAHDPGQSGNLNGWVNRAYS
jgi:lysozyme family protein